MADPNLLVDIIIEQPHGDVNHYLYDPEWECVRLGRVLYAGQRLPADLGAVVASLTPQGTSLGVLLVANMPNFPGAWVTVRPVGLAEVGEGKLPVQRVVAVAEADPYFAHVRDLADLPEWRRQALTEFLQVDGPVKWRNADVARKVIEAARKAARMAQVGLRDGRGPAWKAPEFVAEQDVGHAEGIAHTVAEYSLTTMPYRYQEYIAPLLLPDERILFFVPRPPLERGRWGQREKLNEGLLVVTDQQVLWMVDVLPPAPGMVGYGYLATVCNLERLERVQVQLDTGTATLAWLARSGDGHTERLAVEFPAVSAGLLHRVVAFLEQFLPQSGDLHPRRLAPLKKTETALHDLVESHDRLTLAALPALQANRDRCLADGEFVVCDAIAPAWANDEKLARLVSVTDRQVIVAETTRARAFPLYSISSTDLCHSVIRSWLRLRLPGHADTAEVEIEFPLVNLSQFTLLFLALRQALASAAVYNAPSCGKSSLPDEPVRATQWRVTGQA